MPTILDLYCGAGGAAAGYQRAGFNVIGVDNRPMPRYAGNRFVQFDALAYLDGMIRFPGDGWRIDAIHASPPCQRYSKMSACRPGLRDTYADLVGPTRDRLDKLGLPYVIENVPGAPLKNYTTLCGSQFGLVASWYGEKVGLRRPRKFETSGFSVPEPGPHDHSYHAVPVAGHGVSKKFPHFQGRPGFSELSRAVMGIDWMTRDELNEAVPPAFTLYVGRYLMEHLRAQEREQAA